MVERPPRRCSLLLFGTWEAMPALLHSQDLSQQSHLDLFSRSSGKYPELEFWEVEGEQRMEVVEGVLIWVEEVGLS